MNLHENKKLFTDTYLRELPAIAFSEIPKEDVVAKSFVEIKNHIL